MVANSGWRRKCVFEPIDEAISETVFPALSLPTRDTRSTEHPSDARFAATFPTPPSMFFLRTGLNTGTGASGEIRSTLPYS